MNIQTLLFSTLAIIHFTLGIALVFISRFYKERGIEYVYLNILLRAVYLAAPVLIFLDKNLEWITLITGPLKVLSIPLTWLYFSKLGEINKKPGTADLLHLTVPMVVLLVSLVVFPSQSQQESLGSYEFFNNFLTLSWRQCSNYSNLFVNTRFIVFIQSILYTILISKLYHNYIKRIKQNASWMPDYYSTWVRYGAVFIAVNGVFEGLSFWGIYNIPILFFMAAIPMVAISLFLFLHAFLHEDLAEIISSEEKSIDKKNIEINNNEEKDQQHLEGIMLAEEPFLNPKLTLVQLSILTGIPKYRLPQLFKNSGFDNFHSFVNYYRVEKSKELLLNLPNQMTIDSVSDAAGFNSRSSFFRIFKETTGMSPKQYLDSKGNS